MARRLPSLNALRAFEAAARSQSFTLAAAELNVSHAAVSRHIRELETSLAVALFERTGRGVVLTEDGVRLGHDLTSIFDQLREATGRYAPTRRKNQLVISSEVPFAAMWLIPRLGRFTEAHPEIDLVLDPNNRLVDFAKNEADIGIRCGGGSWPGVAARLLASTIVFPVASPKFISAHPLKSPADLAGLPLIRDDPKDNWESWFAAAGLAARPRVDGPVLKGHLAVPAAEAGQGVVLADQIAVADALLAGRLVKPFDIEVPCRSYYFVHADGARETAAMTAFRKWLETEIAVTTKALAQWSSASADKKNGASNPRKGSPKSRAGKAPV